MSDVRGKPVIGTDAEGEDTYAEVVAAPGGNRVYRHLLATVSTNGALLSVDGGVSDSVYVPAGGGIGMDDIEIVSAVQGKNATAGSNYSALYVTVW